jgi:hypothetical protein
MANPTKTPNWFFPGSYWALFWVVFSLLPEDSKATDGSNTVRAAVRAAASRIYSGAVNRIHTRAAMESADPPYGLSERDPVAPFLLMPEQLTGALPATLSLTGVFNDTANFTIAAGLVPYNVIVPLWSDTAVKSRWMAVPTTNGATATAGQIGFTPTGEWTFPNGTVFVITAAWVLAAQPLRP